MFRTKVFSTLQNIVNSRPYTTGHTNLLQHRLLSTHVLKEDTSKTANISSNVTSNTDQENFSLKSDNSGNNLEKSNDTLKALPGKLHKTSRETSKHTLTAKVELDKLYKKIEVEVRGNDPAVLESYGQFAVMAAEELDITVGRNVALRKAIHERLTVLKSVHVHKKHRVQYEARTYYRYLDFFKLTSSTADTFLEYIQRNLPEGVAMKVTKVEIQKLPETIPQAASPQ